MQIFLAILLFGCGFLSWVFVEFENDYRKTRRPRSTTEYRPKTELQAFHEYRASTRSRGGTNG